MANPPFASFRIATRPGAAAFASGPMAPRVSATSRITCGELSFSAVFRVRTSGFTLGPSLRSISAAMIRTPSSLSPKASPRAITTASVLNPARAMTAQPRTSRFSSFKAPRMLGSAAGVILPTARTALQRKLTSFAFSAAVSAGTAALAPGPIQPSVSAAPPGCEGPCRTRRQSMQAPRAPQSFPAFRRQSCS